MRFSDVPHQDRAVSIIRRALRSGRTHHAYLFDGPEGVGKEHTARALAARLLCQNESIGADDDACGECQACRLLASGAHPDFHDIHRGLHKLHAERRIRESKGLSLSVEVVRQFLIEPSSNTPALGRCRVFLIRQAERMNPQAQNALLKTLEEPPGNGRLILVSASASRLLPTIRSRCQRIPFDLLPTEFVESELRAQADLAEADAQALAALAQGRLGVAQRWRRVGVLEALEHVGECLAALWDAGPEPTAKRLVEIATTLAARTIEDVDKQLEQTSPALEPEERRRGAKSKSSSKTVPTDELRDALKVTLLLVAALLRDALVLEAAPGEQLARLPGRRTVVETLAARLGPDLLDAGIRAVAQAETMLDRNVAPQLVCERLAVALPGEIAVA